MYYIITDEFIARLIKHSKPGIYREEYYRLLSLLKKRPIPEGTSSLKCLGFDSDGKPLKCTIVLRGDSDGI